MTYIDRSLPRSIINIISMAISKDFNYISCKRDTITIGGEFHPVGWHIVIKDYEFDGEHNLSILVNVGEEPEFNRDYESVNQYEFLADIQRRDYSPIDSPVPAGHTLRNLVTTGIENGWDIELFRETGPIEPVPEKPSLEIPLIKIVADDVNYKNVNRKFGLPDTDTVEIDIYQDRSFYASYSGGNTNEISSARMLLYQAPNDTRTLTREEYTPFLFD